MWTEDQLADGRILTVYLFVVLGAVLFVAAIIAGAYHDTIDTDDYDSIDWEEDDK